MVTKVWQECNWLQALEGGIDTAHAPILHRRISETTTRPGISINTNLVKGEPPRLEVDRTDYGYRYAGIRDIGDKGNLIRGYHYVMPFHQLRPLQFGLQGQEPRQLIAGHVWVPMDDEHISVFQYSLSTDTPFTDEQRAMANISPEKLLRVKYKFEDGSVVDTWQPERQLHNDFLIDREMQRVDNYTGIASGREQDMAMTDTMGAIGDRTKEHLGTSDTAIISGRRILLRMARELQEGIEPYAPSHPEVFAVRAIDVVDTQGDFFKLLEKQSELGKAQPIS